MANLGNKYEHRVTLRLNDEQFKYLTTVSSLLGVTPSDYMRMCINTGLVSSGDAIFKVASGELVKGMVGTNENVKTDIDNKL